MRLHIPGNSTVLWGFEARLPVLPSWREALQPTGRIAEVDVMAFVREKRKDLITEQLRLVEHSASAEVFKPVAPPSWMLAIDLFSFLPQSGLFVTSARSTHVVRPQPKQFVEVVGRIAHRRFVPGPPPDPEEMVELAAVRRNHVQLVHAARLVERAGEMRPDRSICTVGGFFTKDMIVEEPVSCMRCLTKLDRASMRPASLVADAARKLTEPDETPVSVLKLRPKVISRLAVGGFETLGSLRSASDEDLLNIRQFGDTSLLMVVTALKQYAYEQAV